MKKTQSNREMEEKVKVDSSKSTKLKDPWKFLKELNIGVYCISLKERDDRYKSCCKQLHKVKLLDQVIFHRPEKHKKGGRVGCFISHKFCMNHALKHRKTAALIFEDDIVFTDEWFQQLETIQKFLEKEPDWNLFRIGCYVLKYWNAATSTDQVYRTSCVQTHAYFVHKSYMQSFLNTSTPHFAGHLDSFYNHTTTKDYALLSPISYQDANLGSDNLWNFKVKGIDVDFGVMAQNFVQQVFNYEQLQKINNSLAYYCTYLPEAYRFNMLPNIIHHSIKEPVLLI